MIKAIVMDFDGVIADSVNVKTEAFRDIFLDYGEENANKMMDYHLENMGISRYKKFQYFFENILNVHYSEAIGIELGNRFSELIVDRIITGPFIKGAKEFLERNSSIYKIFIATGTPQDEIVMIADKKRISIYFNGIFGSPRTKTEIINDIITKHDLIPDEMVFIGDAMSDYNAAKETNLHFVGRIDSYEKNMFPKNTVVLINLTDLIEKIDLFQ